MGEKQPTDSHLPVTTSLGREQARARPRRSFLGRSSSIGLLALISLCALLRLISPSTFDPFSFVAAPRFGGLSRGVWHFGSSSQLRSADKDPLGTSLPHALADQDVPRIAIIGAGAGGKLQSLESLLCLPHIRKLPFDATGSSAAYFLRHFANLTSRNLTTRVTVFESSGYVGGRSTLSWPWQDNPDSPPSPLSDGGQAGGLAPIELGASIFVAANKNLAKAAREFNLTTTRYGRDDDEDDVGIWDGERFVFKQSGRDWWDKVRIIWR